MDLLGSESLDWDDQLEDQGLLMVILSLIMVREGVILESTYFCLMSIEQHGSLHCDFRSLFSL